MPQVVLQTSPSCHDSLSWSEDGEIAVAAGEWIQVLTPKSPEFSKGVSSSSAWHIGRFRVNLFTRGEVSATWPRERDAFSIGAEQSLSSVAGLAWSPPGLATHRRSLLAVLTSNLVLSLWEIEKEGSLETRKWARVAIINHALREHFASQKQKNDDTETSPTSSSQTSKPWARYQKRRIRAFTWLPPLNRGCQTDLDPFARSPINSPSRWGHHLLAVVNDINNTIILRIQRKRSLNHRGTAEGRYIIEVLTEVSIHDPHQAFNMVHEGSLFASALQCHARVMAISAGPWIGGQGSLGEKDNGIESPAKLILAAVYGSRLVLVDLIVTFPSGDGGHDTSSLGDIQATRIDEIIVSGVDLNKVNVTGPLHWVCNGKTAKDLIAGVFGGYLVVSFPNEMYRGKNKRVAKVIGQHRQFLPGSDDNDDDGAEKDINSILWEPVTGITTATTPEDIPIITTQVCTLQGSAEAFRGDESRDDLQVFKPAWYKQVELVKERFDIDYDLGGAVVSRIWGLASLRGWTVVAITVHPSDMIEYLTAGEERVTLVFSQPQRSEKSSTENEKAFLEPLSISEEQHHAARERVLWVLLRHYIHEATVEKPDLSEINEILRARLLYAAAACVVVCHRNAELLSFAKDAFTFISSLYGLDLADEISKCTHDLVVNTERDTVLGPKSFPLADSNNSKVFEICEVCDAGVEWFSEKEARCASGHTFVRCALTSLAIQEPGISKFCSQCGTEYLNEDLAFAAINSATTSTARIDGQPEQMELDLNEDQVSKEQTDDCTTARYIFEHFDTCIYCGGKFRA